MVHRAELPLRVVAEDRLAAAPAETEDRAEAEVRVAEVVRTDPVPFPWARWAAPWGQDLAQSFVPAR
jgi:hypothetical protein